jgi:ankyrin repeat protein
MLILSRFPLDNITRKEETAVAIAAQRGNDAGLEVLIRAGADVNILNKHDVSPLYLAILNDNDYCVETLINSGANVFVDGTPK